MNKDMVLTTSEVQSVIIVFVGSITNILGHALKMYIFCESLKAHRPVLSPWFKTAQALMSTRKYLHENHKILLITVQDSC